MGQGLWVPFPAEGPFYRFQLPSTEVTSQTLTEKEGNMLSYEACHAPSIPVWSRRSLCGTSYNRLGPRSCLLPVWISDPTSQFPHGQD